MRTRAVNWLAWSLAALCLVSFLVGVALFVLCDRPGHVIVRPEFDSDVVGRGVVVCHLLRLNRRGRRRNGLDKCVVDAFRG